MSETLTTVGPLPVPSAQPQEDRKLLDLAVIRQGARDFLSFVDETKEIFYAYVYHRTGSHDTAQTLMVETYLKLLNRAMSLWWFGRLSFRLLTAMADKALETLHVQNDADLDTEYLPTLAWMTADQRVSMGSLHETLWTLPAADQQILILSYLAGVPKERIAALCDTTLTDIESRLAQATTELLKRWQPVAGIDTQLTSLVYMPAINLAREASMRFTLVEKYNALRMRRYQWLIIGGLFAVLSNVIVASVLAFVVITAPATSLRGVQGQLAQLDAVAIQRLTQEQQVRSDIASLYQHTQDLTSIQSATDLTKAGLSSLRKQLDGQEQQKQKLQKILDNINRVKTALAPVLPQTVLIAWDLAETALLQSGMPPAR